MRFGGRIGWCFQIRYDFRVIGKDFLCGGGGDSD
jgi:hypothetical protein